MPNVRQMLHLFASRKFQSSPEKLNHFVDKMNNGEKFTFSRFGDGEWSAVLLRDGANCDGHNYSKGLSIALNDALNNSKNYYYGMQDYALKNLGRDIVSYLKKNKSEIMWYNASIFHDANLAGELNPFVKALRTKKVVVIGPEYLKELTLFPIEDFVAIPQVNCFDAYDEIKTGILNANVPDEDTVYLFSASMASNALIHDLYDELGEKNWLLDVGALWDVYVGKKSRSIYSEDWAERIKINSSE